MRPRFDVVFYAPWASSLVGGSSAGGAAGGTETQLLLLARALAGRGLRVAMIVIGTPAGLPAEHEGVRIVPQAPRRRTTGALARVGLALGALRAMASVRTDVLVQMNAGPTTAVAALCARLRGARFVYSSASTVDFEFDSIEGRALNVRLFEWGVRRASTVIVQNEGQAEQCRARFGIDPVVLPSIADRSERRTARPEAFLWVGRLQPIKRPEPYLALARAIPEAHFWMIAVPQPGEPAALRQQVEEAARELPNLELLPPRSRSEVGALLDRAVAVVSTSVREGLPNVFLEGWSRGVPALALSFDPDGLIAGHGLGAVAGDDPDRFEDEARQMWLGRDDQADVAGRCVAFVAVEHDESAVVDGWQRALEATRGGGRG